MTLAGLIILVVYLIVCAAPLGVILGLIGLYSLEFFSNGLSSLAAPAVWNVFTDFTLTAVPLFIAMGDILLEGGMSKRIYASVTPLFRRVPGGLLQTNVAVATLFGAVCGSSTATAAAVGSVAYPELSRRGYDKPTIVGSLAGSGTLGLLIPPSISLLIYGATLDVSIGKLFVAGILPGLGLALLFMVYIAIYALWRPNIVAADPDSYTWGQTFRKLTGIWPLVILMGAVLGTIYAGLATPTEAAAIGVAAAALIGFMFQDLTIAKLLKALINTAASFGTIALVLFGALVLAQAVSILAIPRQIVEIVIFLELSKYTLLLAVVLIYLLLGCFFDGLSLMIMTLPFVFPVMTAVGFDPVWLGVVITILVEVGMITPPVGMNLFVISAMTRGEVGLYKTARATIPYWLILLFGVAVLAAFPSIATWLPSLI